MKLILLIGLLFSILTGCSDNLKQKYEKYNVIWDSQSKDSWGSMPAGNGDIGANVWVTADGELQFFISKTDAFSENARLLKIGKVTIKFTPNILSGKNFRQELDLYSGKIRISTEESGQKAALDFWIDANNPAIVIDGKCDIPVKMEVSYEGWRTRRRELAQKEMHSAYGLYGSPDPVYVEPDTILRKQAELLWCHHNKRSIWKNVLELQALGELTHQLDDPLLNRTFGALVYGKNLSKASDIKLVSSKTDKKFNVNIIVNTEFAENTSVWAQDISDLKIEIEKQSIAKRKQAHNNWWKSFWNRHYLFIDSKTQPEETFTVTHGYLLQRYINACGGRGKLPIKFNGSIFTVDVANDFNSSGVNLKGNDADYRTWGGCFAGQNTRLPYWTMLYSGDFEMMKPLFKMYVEALPILKTRTRKYYGHDGAFCSESMYFWGTYNNNNYGWNREGMPDGLTKNMYIRYYWGIGIELVAMMQDYYLFTGDTDFLNNQLSVFAREILTFYNEHYQKDETGKIVIYPTQSLETYWEGTINPLPEIAGLKFITERFMKMDTLTGNKHFISLCETVRNSLPAIPVRQDDDGQQLLSPAQVLTWKKRNSENPELYAVFPYRLFGQGKSNLEVARNTFNKRLHKQFSGWQQDAIQAALLGLTGEAQRMIVHNFGEKHKGSRFPAFWGPNYDWIPDQDHGNVNVRALQNMLIQDIDDKIHLFPAWPKEWDVTFKMHAPQNTVIEGKWENGKSKKLKVVPENRRKDIIIKNEKTVPAKTYCNPINLNYRFQLEQPSRREAADPAVIFFKEEYYLFASKSGGYWNSADLVNWKYIPADDLPTEDYAPAVVAIGDTMYFVASSHDKMPMYKTIDPKSGKWNIANPEFPFPIWDPAFFLDDDGRLYLYWGCSNKAPLYAIELDPENNLNPIGERVICFGADIEQHGWEIRGDYNELNENPWLEGAWMNKHNGKYYLQYSAPGTEMRSYADGVYTASSPLGPFEYALYSPFSRKARGFVTGTGHGCTFTDKFGNYWHATTMVICVKQMFERRLCIFPAGFDKDGVLYAQTAFGDYPHYMPGGKSDFISESTFTNWMLLSYKKQASASSAIEGYSTDQAFDEDVKTYWAAQSGKDEWLSADLGKKCRINAIQVNFAEHETKLFDRQPDIYYQYIIEYSNDEKQWEIIVDKSSNKSDCPHDYVQLDTPVKARYIKLKVLHIPDGKVAVSGLRIFGNGLGEKPGKVDSFTVVRNEKDPRIASITWDKSPDATGYIVRYGTEKNRLYNQFMVYQENLINVICLNKGIDYFFSIDSFNENGVTRCNKIVEHSKKTQ